MHSDKFEFYHQINLNQDMKMEILDKSMFLTIFISIYSATYGCRNKNLIHISSIKEEFYDDCVGTDFIQGFITSFLDACNFQPRNVASRGACILQCIQQSECEAMAYNVTGGCYVSLQGGAEQSTGGHHVGVTSVYIDKEMFKEHIGYFHTANSLPFIWCSDASQDVFVGDFNGDGLDDLLCHQRRAGGVWPQGKIGIAYNRPGSGFSGQRTGVNNNIWEFEMNWCIGTDEDLHIADFNGDGRDDMLCNNYDRTLDKCIAFATAEGRFNDISWQGLPNWCFNNQRLFSGGDFNGDRRSDWVCKRFTDGETYTLFANLNGSFGGIHWHYEIDWCKGNDAELFTTGDFNGDGLSDWLCRRPAIHMKMVSLTNADRSFSGTDWHQEGEFCHMDSQKLVIGDFNGDGLSDMLCRDVDIGYTWIFLAVESPTVWFGGIVWQSEGWCRGENNQLLFGDFDGDGKTDALCKSSNNLCYTTSD